MLLTFARAPRYTYCVSEYFKVTNQATVPVLTKCLKPAPACTPQLRRKGASAWAASLPMSPNNLLDLPAWGKAGAGLGRGVPRQSLGLPEPFGGRPGQILRESAQVESPPALLTFPTQGSRPILITSKRYRAEHTEVWNSVIWRIQSD